MPTPRARAEWAARVHAEYRSAAHSARLAHLCIACGLDEDLARRALQVAGEELDHARLSHQVLVALGGGDEPQAIDAGELLLPPSPDGPLADLVDLAVRGFCLGETFAVPLFAAMRTEARHPRARDVLDRILADEARHRQLGWDMLDALLALDPDGVRRRVQDKLPGWLDAFRQAYRPADEAVPLSDEERAVGLLPAAAYRQAHDRCRAEDIGARLRARGLG